MTKVYDFRRVTRADHDMLAEWRKEQHVVEWWGTSEPHDDAALADARVARWIVSCAGRPFAYMQDYTVHGWPDHPFAHLPAGSRGIDQFIGPPDMLGRGHGTAFIAARIASLVSEGAPVIAVDPHPDNARAIASYRKAGFAVEGPARDTQWGRILPMIMQARV